MCCINVRQYPAWEPGLLYAADCQMQRWRCGVTTETLVTYEVNSSNKLSYVHARHDGWLPETVAVLPIIRVRTSLLLLQSLGPVGAVGAS